MMQCPSCSTLLVAGEARCVSCHALVNPPVHGAGALAPRLVTPQSIDGLGPPSESTSAPSPAAPKVPESRNPDDDAWRREVLERVRKRRQVRTHALPLFVDGQGALPAGEVSKAEPFVTASAPSLPALPPTPLDEAIIEELADALESADPRPPLAAPDLLASLDVPLGNAPQNVDERDIMDLPLRPAELEAPRAKGAEASSQNLVERPRPVLITGPVASRSLVADLPLVEPSRLPPPLPEPPPRSPSTAVNPRAASMNDRAQAALIDVGMWAAMSVTAFYFASRIARTSIFGLGPAWAGLTLFALVLAAAYILFFGGLSGATPGKIACGIQVRRYDGTSLGPLPSLARGFLGILGVAFLGVGIWPAFWDRDRRALHDRATDSRVTIV
jgi:uncharacterized RDD family membrane protein YckC